MKDSKLDYLKRYLTSSSTSDFSKKGLNERISYTGNIGLLSEIKPKGKKIKKSLQANTKQSSSTSNVRVIDDDFLPTPSFSYKEASPAPIIHSDTDDDKDNPIIVDESTGTQINISLSELKSNTDNLLKKKENLNSGLTKTTFQLPQQNNKPLSNTIPDTRIEARTNKYTEESAVDSKGSNDIISSSRMISDENLSSASSNLSLPRKRPNVELKHPMHIPQLSKNEPEDCKPPETMIKKLPKDTYRNHLYKNLPSPPLHPQDFPASPHDSDISIPDRKRSQAHQSTSERDLSLPRNTRQTSKKYDNNEIALQNSQNKNFLTSKDSHRQKPNSHDQTYRTQKYLNEKMDSRTLSPSRDTPDKRNQSSDKNNIQTTHKKSSTSAHSSSSNDLSPPRNYFRYKSHSNKNIESQQGKRHSTSSNKFNKSTSISPLLIPSYLDSHKRPSRNSSHSSEKSLSSPRKNSYALAQRIPSDTSNLRPQDKKHSSDELYDLNNNNRAKVDTSRKASNKIKTLNVSSPLSHKEYKSFTFNNHRSPHNSSKIKNYRRETEMYTPKEIRDSSEVPSKYSKGQNIEKSKSLPRGIHSSKYNSNSVESSCTHRIENSRDYRPRHRNFKHENKYNLYNVSDNVKLENDHIKIQSPKHNSKLMHFSTSPGSSNDFNKEYLSHRLKKPLSQDRHLYLNSHLINASPERFCQTSNHSEKDNTHKIAQNYFTDKKKGMTSVTPQLSVSSDQILNSDENLNSTVVYRDKTGKTISKDEWYKLQESSKKKKRPKPIEQILEWGEGLVQKKEKEDLTKEHFDIAAQPFARYEVDNRHDNELKQKMRWGDPFFDQMMQTTSSPNSPKIENQKPKCKFPPPPNRFNIPPGYRWDGVIRGTGFEERRMIEINKAKNKRQTSHMWNIADM